MSKYPKSPEEPSTLAKMAAMMGLTKPAPPIADPVTVAKERIYRIYMDVKHKILIGDKSPGSIIDALTDAMNRTEKEVSQVKLRNDAVNRYQTMIDRLNAGGPVEL